MIRYISDNRTFFSRRNDLVLTDALASRTLDPPLPYVPLLLSGNTRTLMSVPDNAWHMAVGMLLQLNNLPSKAAQLQIPSAIIDQCKPRH